jgi:hypothetical protein
MPVEWLEEVLQTINGMCIDNLPYRKAIEIKRIIRSNDVGISLNNSK